MNAPYTLHLGDSREVLKTLPDNSVDAIVTDPPYGLSKEPDMAEVLSHWLAGDDYTASGGGFMGKTWDSFVPCPAVWRECMRVLKPGGHLLAFFGSRTYDLGTLAIRLAGFEIRDSIQWIYGSGMPKSMNLDRERGKSICGCVVANRYDHGNTSQDLHDLRKTMDAEEPVSNVEKPDMLESVQGTVITAHGRTETKTSERASWQKFGCLRGMRDQVLAQHEATGEDETTDMQPEVQRETPLDSPGAKRLQTSWTERPKSEVAGDEQPGMEGRGDDASSPRQLRASEVRAGAGLGSVDGAQGRLRDGAPSDHGGMVRISADTDGGCSSRRPHATEQCERQPGAMAGQPKPQAMGAWPVCGGCGLPMVPKGLGTALKPAHEPICVARKPLIGTVAANVLEHGTGALNIDACRVGDEVRSASFTSFAPCHGNALGAPGTADAKRGTQGDPKEYVGRWPANVIHDGSDEVIAAFPNAPGQMADASLNSSARKVQNVYGAMRRGRGDESSANSDNQGAVGFKMKPGARRLDTGSAARFFYAAKASKRDRDDGLDGFEEKPSTSYSEFRETEAHSPKGTHNTRANIHPTVKPTDLMAYLCRLVTPPGGVVLDPFMGSGSTGKACMREGFRFIGIDMTPEYVEIARARIAHELAKQIPVPAAPAPQMDLFGETS